METPRGQIDFGLGVLACPKCGGPNFKGVQMCGHGSCGGTFPIISTISGDTSRSTYVRRIDRDRYKGGDLEAIASGKDAIKVKRGWAEDRMDRLSDSIKRAKTESDSQKFRRLRDQTLHIYKKYNG